MIYKTLTPEQTAIWISNIEKVISLRDILYEKNIEREKFRDSEYKEKYLTKWTKIFFSKTCYTQHYTGNIHEYDSLFCKLKYMTHYTHYELHNMYQSHDYKNKYKKKYKMIHERWTKYASQPFQLEETDVIFYQNMKEYHADALIIAKGLNLDYEAYYLDEDC